MPPFSPDASCIVAAVCTWHVHHDPAEGEIAQRLDRAETMIVAAHALVEAYAVLTRLPPPFRLAPADARALLDANFIRLARIVALGAGSYRRLLRRAPGDGIAGGQTYDAVIAECLLKTAGTTLLTFNVRPFMPFSRRGLKIVVPGQGIQR